MLDACTFELVWLCLCLYLVNIFPISTYTLLSASTQAIFELSLDSWKFVILECPDSCIQSQFRNLVSGKSASSKSVFCSSVCSRLEDTLTYTHTCTHTHTQTHTHTLPSHTGPTRQSACPPWHSHLGRGIQLGKKHP